jgi:geranylgeranyl reductase family protein
VAVVGAGPAGSFLAGLLASRGLDVAVLEEHPEVGVPVHCAGIVGLEAFRRFHLDEKAVLDLISGFSVISPSGRVLRHRREEPFAAVVDRTAFDQGLAREAERRGARFFTSARVTEAEEGLGKLRLVAVRGERRETFFCRVAVLATGEGSPLVRRLFGSAPGRMFAAQVEYPVEGLEETEIFLGRKLAPGSFAWAVPLPGGVARVGLMVRREPRSYLRAFLELLEREGRLPRGGAGEALSLSRVSVLPEGPLPRTVRGRMLVVGEAAGQVKTTSGGGIYYGLIGSSHAARALELAFQRGEFGETLLSYERLWRGELEGEIRLGSLFRRLAALLDDRAVGRLLSLFRGKHGERVLSSFPFDWHSGFLRFLVRSGALRSALRQIP